MIRRPSLIVIAILIASLLYAFLSHPTETNKSLALLAFVTILWLTEAIHTTTIAFSISIIVILLGLKTTKSVLQAFADPTIFLFFGGFATATVLDVQQLDKYVAYKVIVLARGNFMVAVFLLLLVTAFPSMGISNTATVTVIIPLAIGMLKGIDYKGNKDICVFVILGIVYSASIGGMDTLVDSPPNAIMAPQLKISSSERLQHSTPTILSLMPLMLDTMYLIFRSRLNIKVTPEVTTDKLNSKQYVTILIFAVTALYWIFDDTLSVQLSSPLDINKINDFDAVITMIAAIAVCMTEVVEWKRIQGNTDWGVLMLLNEGLSLNLILIQSGASKVLVDSTQFLIAGQSHFVIGPLVATFIILLIEFTLNTASTALLMPIFILVAGSLGVNPLGLSLVIGLGASCAFALPVATPPNAIAFGTEMISQRDMIKAGFVLNILSIIFISIIAYFFWGGTD